MLRVGLTGGLGSGKSTVARTFALHGVYILETDLIGRELMLPGQPVYREILRHFRQYPDAPRLTVAGGMLDRSALAEYVFSTGRLQELNRIIHPAVIAEQERSMQLISQEQPDAIVMVESALIFEADRGGTAPGLRHRFDKLILVTAPESTRIARYIQRVSGDRTISSERRSALEDDARRRIGMQMTDAEKAPLCDFVIENSGPLEQIEPAVHHILTELRRYAVIAATKRAPA
ncbi:MAG: dephospho-CoA kinase [Acidobacteriaceae bacterium]